MNAGRQHESPEEPDSICATLDQQMVWFNTSRTKSVNFSCELALIVSAKSVSNIAVNT